MAEPPEKRSRQLVLTSDCESEHSEEQSQGSSSGSAGTHKRRQFLQHWLKIYPWLTVEGTGEDITVYCRDCKRAKLSNEFAKGKKRPSSGWKKEYLQRHSDSNRHTRHAPMTAQMVEAVKYRGFFQSTSKSATEQQTLGLLHDIYFVVTNGLPVYKSDALHCLVEFQLRYISDESDGQRRSYLSKSHRTNDSTWEFVHALNSVVENNDISKLKEASFFSLLLDESNDISVTKNLMVYVQFVDVTSNSVEVMFLRNAPLSTCDADSIVSVITEIFTTMGVNLKKMIMFTSDGAAVMLGCNNGVYVKLKALSTPHLIEYHCVAHREALAVGDAYRSISYFIKLESVIKAIFSHFSHSSVRTANLKNVFTVLHIRLTKIHDIRWLSRMEAVEAIVKSYEVLVTYFEDLSQQDVVASGLVKQLKTYRFVLSLHFLLDVLTTLGQLSKTFQILAYHPCDACHKIAEVCDVLQDRYLRDTFRWGPKAAECIEKMEKGDIDVIEAGDEEKRKLRKDCIDFVTEVLNNLKSRFPRTQQGVVEATKIFDPGNLPNDDVLATYGEDELDVLSLHYSEFVDRSQCQSEWEMLKRCMSANYRKMKLQTFALKLAVDEGMKFNTHHYPFLPKYIQQAQHKLSGDFQPKTSLKTKPEIG